MSIYLNLPVWPSLKMQQRFGSQKPAPSFPKGGHVAELQKNFLKIFQPGVCCKRKAHHCQPRRIPIAGVALGFLAGFILSHAHAAQSRKHICAKKQVAVKVESPHCSERLEGKALAPTASLAFARSLVPWPELMWPNVVKQSL